MVKYDIEVEPEPMIKCAKGLRMMFGVRKGKILTLTEITSTESNDTMTGEMSERMETEATFIPQYHSPRSRRDSVPASLSITAQ